MSNPAIVASLLALSMSVGCGIQKSSENDSTVSNSSPLSSVAKDDNENFFNNWNTEGYWTTERKTKAALLGTGGVVVAAAVVCGVISIKRHRFCLSKGLKSSKLEIIPERIRNFGQGHHHPANSIMAKYYARYKNLDTPSPERIAEFKASLNESEKIVASLMLDETLDLADQLTAVNRLIELNPENYHLYLNRSGILNSIAAKTDEFDTGKLADIFADIDKALELNPDAILALERTYYDQAVLDVVKDAKFKRYLEEKMLRYFEKSDYNIGMLVDKKVRLEKMLETGQATIDGKSTQELLDQINIQFASKKTEVLNNPDSFVDDLLEFYYRGLTEGQIADADFLDGMANFDSKNLTSELIDNMVEQAKKDVVETIGEN